MKTIENLKYEIRHVRAPLAKEAKDFSASDQWLVKIFYEGGFFTVDYYTGYGHRELTNIVFLRDYLSPEQIKLAKGCPSRVIGLVGFGAFLQCTKPKTPTIKDIIFALYMDSAALNESFTDWCSNYGYSDDSLKALNTYKACCENGQKLRKLKFSQEYLENVFEDY